MIVKLFQHFLVIQSFCQPVLRYIAAAIVIGLIRGIITEYLFLRLSRNDTSGRATP